MTKFKGFKTKEEAKAYQKEHGGYLTYRYTKSGRKSSSYIDYEYAVHLGGFDADTYPYCLQWANC